MSAQDGFDKVKGDQESTSQPFAGERLGKPGSPQDNKDSLDFIRQLNKKPGADQDSELVAQGFRPSGGVIDLSHGQSETELFRERLTKQGIDPDKCNVGVFVYEPIHDEDKEGRHARNVQGFIRDPEIGLTRNAPVKVITDRELEALPGAYVDKPNGLSEYIRAYSVAGMDSLTNSLNRYCLGSDRSPDMRVFSVSQAFSQVDCTHVTLKAFQNEPEKHSRFIKELLGDEKGQKFIDEHLEFNRALATQKEQAEKGERMTMIASHPDHRLVAELEQKLYDQVDNVLSQSREFQQTMDRYRQTTKAVADKGIAIVVGVANDGLVEKVDGIKIKPGAGYNWYAMSDDVISVGGSDIADTPGKRDDDRMYAASSKGTERWHPTVLAQGDKIPTHKDGSGTVNGTSFATPQVSATIAMMFARNPELTVAEAKRILSENASKINGVSETVQGAGILEIDKAVIAAAR